jgi:hypothetical protein
LEAAGFADRRRIAEQHAAVSGNLGHEGIVVAGNDHRIVEAQGKIQWHSAGIVQQGLRMDGRAGVLPG